MFELKIGGRDRDRTCGLIHAMDALSQLSYTPVTEKTICKWFGGPDLS
jgi:hypothetical protein